MKSVQEVLSQIKTHSDCVIYPPQGFPELRPFVLPEDLLAFYTYCGGLSLFRSSPYSIEIVPPTKLLLANPIIMGISEDKLKSSIDAISDISWSWYLIAEGANAQYITLDLSPKRLGRCYDSFWEIYATPGYMPIIAKSFTELLNRLVKNQRNHWYWLQPGAKSYGDAYDI